MRIKKRSVMKFTNEYIKLACNVKLDKFLHKLAKNNKSIKIMKTMEILHDKNNMMITTLRAKSTTSCTIINNMGVIILDPNTMQSNDTAR